MRQVTRALIGFIRGSSHPRSVAWAVYLGMLAGFVTGMNLTLAVLLLVVILLDVRTRVFLLSWAGGFALSWPLMPVTLRIGQFLLDRSPLGSQLAGLGETPLMALLDWDRYALVGGAALAALGALPAASVAARFVQSRRDLARGSGHTGFDSQAVPGGSNSPEVGFRHGLVRRFFLGSDLDESAGRPSAVVKVGSGLHTRNEARWLRPLGPIVFPVALAIVFVLPYWIGPSLVGRALLDRFSELNGADVEAAAFHLSLSDGRFDLTGLAIADPVHLRRDRLRVERIHGKLRPGALLRGRLEIERVELDGLRANVARRQPARPFDGHPPTIDAERLVPPSDPLLGSLAPSSDAPERAKELRIDRYLRSWPRLRDQLDLLSALARQLEALPEADARSNGNLLALSGTANLWARRSPLGQSKPLLRIDHLRADSLPAPWGFGSTATLELAAVTSRPSMESEPTRLALVSPQMNADVNAAFNLHQDVGKHELRFLAHQLDLADLVDRRACRGRFTAREGMLSVIGAGWVDRQGLELALEVDAAALDVKLLGERSVAGLATPMWNEGLERLGRFYGRVMLRGDWKSPELVLDADHLVQQFKHQLRAAGAHQLVDAVEVQLAAADSMQLSKDAAAAGRYGSSALDEVPLTPAPADGQMTAGDAEPLGNPAHSHSDRFVESDEGRTGGASQTLAGSHRPQVAPDVVWSPGGGVGPEPWQRVSAHQPRRDRPDRRVARSVPPAEMASDPRWTVAPPQGWPMRGATRPPVLSAAGRPQPPTQMGWTPPVGSPTWGNPGSAHTRPPQVPLPAPIELRRGYDDVDRPSLAGAQQPWTPGLHPALQRPGAQAVVGQPPGRQTTGPKRAVPWPTQFVRWARRVMGSDKQDDEGESAKVAPAGVAGRAQPTGGALPGGPQQPPEQTVRRYEPGLERWYEQLWR